MRMKLRSWMADNSDEEDEMQDESEEDNAEIRDDESVDDDGLVDLDEGPQVRRSGHARQDRKILTYAKGGTPTEKSANQTHVSH